MKRFTGFGIVALIMIAIDIYVFQAIRFLMQGSGDRARLTVFSIYWTVSILALITVLAFPFITAFQTNKFLRNYVFAIVVGLFFAKLLAAVFFLIDDIRRGTVWVMGKAFSNTGARFMGEGTGIPRSTFLSWLGMGIGGGFLGTFIYGFSNKYDYQVKHLKLRYDNLPASFRGLKIVQLSDIHSGSFQDRKAVEKGVALALAQQPDLVLFTGDIVNDLASEMEPYQDVFSRLRAPLGVYSVLGNHDYGDYYQWKDKDEAHLAREKEAGRKLHSPLQVANIEKLKGIHAAMGWRLLLNEHVALEKDGEKIGLLGVENWGARGFIPFDFGRVKGVNAVHSSSFPDGSYAGNPMGFVFNTTEADFYYSGDTALTLDMQLIPRWARLKFSVMPVGGNFTMDVQDAISAAEFVECDTVVGVHYDTFPPIRIDAAAAIKAFEHAGKKLLLPKIGDTIAL